MENAQLYFSLDVIACAMLFLIVWVGSVVFVFSKKYMEGEKKRGRFLSLIISLSFALVLLVLSDHVVIFGITWAAINGILLLLLGHYDSWKPARNAAWYVGSYLLSGSTLLAIALTILSYRHSSFSIQLMAEMPGGIDFFSRCALFLIIAAAAIQSATIPFHRWLLSSMNAPTPVSALMHAGLINGGGFLLIRFSPLILTDALALHVLFLMGVVSVLIATGWKFIQSDIKRMLACSTVAQMGFMFIECGIGFFSAALVHILWHGLFKCCLFLNSGENSGEKYRIRDLNLSYYQIIITFVCGFSGVFAFTYGSGIDFWFWDSRIVLFSAVFLASAQLAATLTQYQVNLVFITICTLFFGAVYGANVGYFEQFLSLEHLNFPQKLSFLYFAGTALMLAFWLIYNFVPHGLSSMFQDSVYFRRIYVWALNKSRPHPSTVTTHRAQYRI